MKLCVALDMDSLDSNLNLAYEIKRNFANKDIWLKVGLNAFIRDGVGFIERLQRLDFRIFLDLKIYDIPNTMLNALIEMQKLNIDMLTIHASSGLKAMRLLALHLQETNADMKIVAVSALTSFDNDAFSQIYNAGIESSVRNFANLVYEAGLSGLVCSIDEVEIIKSVSPTLLAVTPGIRPDFLESGIESKSQKDSKILMESSVDFNALSKKDSKILNDQTRVATPKVAKKLGSDFIVVGRPIYNAKDKIKVIDSILKDL